MSIQLSGHTIYTGDFLTVVKIIYRNAFQYDYHLDLSCDSHFIPEGLQMDSTTLSKPLDLSHIIAFALKHNHLISGVKPVICTEHDAAVKSVPEIRVDSESQATSTGFIIRCKKPSLVQRSTTFKYSRFRCKMCICLSRTLWQKPSGP